TVTNARGDKPKAATRLPQAGDAAGAPALAALAASGLAVAAGALLRRREG
ncbi:LPXTG cell wall anchor domain-containing protein, partial [Olsenella uli]